MIECLVRCARILSVLLALVAASSVETRPVQDPPVAAVEESARPAPCLIEEVTHETGEERTRVILRASAPFEYRGGRLMGDQVILDLANARWALPSPVVEILAPEVTRVIAGPEISREGEQILKVRLTGVKARTHKVVVKGNELHIELTSVDGERGRPRGLPKVIRNDSDIVT